METPNTLAPAPTGSGDASIGSIFSQLLGGAKAYYEFKASMGPEQKLSSGEKTGLKEDALTAAPSASKSQMEMGPMLAYVGIGAIILVGTVLLLKGKVR